MQINIKNKRTQAAIVLVIAAVLVLSGAFAWYTFSQNRINTFELSATAPNVNLHDDFEGGTEKDVYVENSGDFNVLVRVKLSELIKRGNDTVPANAVDDDDAFGWHVHTPSADGCDICGFEAHNYFDWTMDGQKLYMPAHNSAKGSDSVEPIAVGDKETVIDYGALLQDAFTEIYAGDQAGLDAVLALMDAYLGGDDTAAADLMAEIAKIPDTYTVSVKQYAEQPETEYIRRLNEVRLTLVPDTIITMQDWIDGTTYGTPLLAGDFWVMDADGWCYWANAVAPNAATGQLLSEVSYKNNYSGGEFTYKINVNLNATSLDGTSLATFFLIAEQNGGISEEAMILMFLASGEYIFGEDGEIYLNDGDGFYRKVNKNNGRYVNYTLGEKIYVSPGTLPGSDGGLSVGGQFDLDGDGNMTDGDSYRVEDITIGDDGVAYYDVGGGVYITTVDESGNPDNSGEKYAIVHTGIDGQTGNDDDIGPVRTDGNYPQWYFIDITDVTDGDVIEAGQKGSLIRANSADDVPAGMQTFGVTQTVYRVQSITRGENGLLYLKLDEDLYAVALNAYGSTVNLTMSETWDNGETVPIPSTYYIIYPGESGKIGTDNDTTDIMPSISAQPVPISGVYDGAAKTLSVTASGAGTRSYQWYKDGEAIAGAASNTLAVTDVADSGSYYCTVTADVKGHSSASINTNTATVSITERPITITAGSASKDYDGSPLTHDNYSITSGSLASGDSLSVTVSGTITDIGTADNEISAYTITRLETDVAANYNVTTVNGTLTVGTKTLSGVIINVTSSHTYNGTAQTPIFTVKDGSTTLESGTHFTAVISNNTNAGSALITLNGAGGYSGTVSQSFTIEKAALTVTANSQATTYGNTAPANSVVYSGFVNGQNETALGGTLSYDCSYTATSDVGTYPITPKGLTSSNYAITFTNGTLTVGKRPITITTGSASKEYDGLALTINSHTITSGTLVGADTINATYGGSITNVGTANSTIATCKVMRSSTEVTANYNVTTVNGTLTITSPFSGGGAGTPALPFLIANKTDLEKLRDKVNANTNFATGKHFKQTANIDLGSANWTPIGLLDNPFKGEYNGSGNKVSSLKGSPGLFAYVNGGTVRNLYVEGNAVLGTSSLVGGIVASLTDGTISDCVFSGRVLGDCAGGIVGGAYGSSLIERCYVTYGSEVTGTFSMTPIGGIAGGATGGSAIRSCYSLAKVGGTANSRGGVVGENSGTVTNCAFMKTGALNEAIANAVGSGSGTATNCGGFVAVTDTYIIIPTSGNPTFGDLLALLNTDQTGTPWIQTNPGVSWPVLSAINREHDGWDGKADSSLEYVFPGVTIISSPAEYAAVVKRLNSSVSENVDVNDKYMFKLVKDIDLNGVKIDPLGISSTLSFRTQFNGDGYAIKGVNIQSTGDAGLFGHIDEAIIQNLKVEGYVSSSGGMAGGIAARAHKTGEEKTTVKIINCSFTGNVFSSSSTGGIIADVQSVHVTMENCYVGYKSRVFSNTGVYAGGLCGVLLPGANTSSIKNCYSLAEVSTALTTYNGGVAGWLHGTQITASRNVFLRTTSFNSARDAFGTLGGTPTMALNGYFGDGGTGLMLTNGSTGSMPANLLALLQQDVGAGKWRAAQGGENGGYPVLSVMR